MVGAYVVDVVELGARRLIGLDPLGARRSPWGLRVPPKWEAMSLVCWKGVLPAQAQPAWYMLSILGPPRASRPPRPSRAFKVLLDGVGDAVLGQQFADGPVLSLGARSVVAEDVEDQGVVAHTQALQLVDELAGLHVDVLHEAGVDLHQAALEGS